MAAVWKDTPYGKRGSRFIDLLNFKFNRLLVIKFSGINRHGRAEWVCRCDCGQETVVEGKQLKSGNVKSCGCLWLESISLPAGEADLNARYLEYQNGAKKRNLSFSLSKEYFRTLTTNTKCNYCNRDSKGVDRINNEIGYEPENVVPCCKRCNIAKNTMSRDDFLSLISDIYNNIFSGDKK